MADSLYENWWMNLTESNCGIYYRGVWYSSELELNSHGYYLVYTRTLYLGSSYKEYKYQKDYYLLGEGDYKTYSQVHSLGYSEYLSYDYYFIYPRYKYYLGYYNSTEGYYIDDGGNVWYSTLQDLHDSGYEVGDGHTYIYKRHELKRYDAIIHTENNTTKYFIVDQNIDYWFTEEEMDSLDLSFLPSVEINWNLGRSFSSNIGHGNHASYSANFDQLLRNGSSVYLSEMDALLGYQKAQTEYNCSGAYVGNYKTEITGEKLWFECYGSSTSSRENLIASFYTNDPSSTVYNASYTQYQRIAVCFGKEVEVVRVYDKCNLPYSAFKVKNKKDKKIYYYICDGVARGWVEESELSSNNFYLEELEGVYKISASAYKGTVELPDGYSITSIKTIVIYSYPSYVYNGNGNGDTVAYAGKDSYSKAISLYQLSRVNGYVFPRLYILQTTSTSEKGKVTGTRFTADTSSSSPWTEFTERGVNNTDPTLGDYFIYLKGNSNGYITSANSGYPAFITIYTDVNSSNRDPNAFIFPSSLYRENNNHSLEWLGDVEDPQNLPYFYYDDPVKIYLYAEDPNDRITIVEILDLVTKNIQRIEYWPHKGYRFNSLFYSASQLQNIGYHVINHSNRINTVFDTEGLEYIPACYNVTSNTSSFSTSSYRHPLLVNGEEVLYAGSCDIIVEIGNTEKNNKIVNRLMDMPSTTTSSYSGAYGLYSVFTPSTNPRVPFNRNVIGQSLVFMIGSNYNNTINYKAPLSITLLIDPFQLLEFEERNILKMEDETTLVGYYNTEDHSYLIKNVGTYSDELTLRSNGYILYDPTLTFFVENQTTHNVYSAYCYPSYGFYINKQFYSTQEEYEAAGYIKITDFYTIDLNDQWVYADPTTDASIISQAGAGYTVLKSNSNYHVGGGIATMYVNILINAPIIFKGKVSSEAGYDKAIYTIDGEELYNASGNNEFTSFTVSNAAGKQMVVQYRKDGSVDSGSDRAYLAIPNT